MSDESNAPAKAENPETCVCTICGKSFKGARYLKSHTTLTHSKKQLKNEKATEDPTTSVETSTPPVEEAPVEVPEDTPPPPLVERSNPEAPSSVPEVEVEVVSPPAPPGTPPARLLDIPVGSLLQLDGPTWRQDPATGVWDSAVVSKLPVRVYNKVLSNGDMMLLCQADGSSAIWAVQLAHALSGAVTILMVAPPLPAGTPEKFDQVSMGCTVEGEAPCEIGDETARAEEEKKRLEEERKRLEEEERKRVEEAEQQRRDDMVVFKTTAHTYLEEQESLRLAQMSFESRMPSYVEFFESFIQKYGSDGFVEAEGFAAQLSDDPELPFQDEAGLVDWCQESGNDDLLALKIDKVKWAAFKRSVVAGTAPGAANLEAVQKLLAKMEGEPLKKLSIRKL